MSGSISEETLATIATEKAYEILSAASADRNWRDKVGVMRKGLSASRMRAQMRYERVWGESHF
jgi:hypothetical protein